MNISTELAETLYGMVRSLADEYDQARHYCDSEDYESLERQIAECGSVASELNRLIVKEKDLGSNQIADY